MSDMADAASDESPGETDGDQASPDRRSTIDLVRVERGEPERRKLPRPQDLGIPPETAGPADDGG